MRKIAIILAGGVGKRAGTDIPKQFHKLLGIPMLWWSVRAFHREDPATELRIVIHPDWQEEWRELYSELADDDRQIPVAIYSGGASRGESVKNGMEGIEASDEIIVAVHDAARPMVTTGMIYESWVAAEQFGAAVPVCAVSDSLRKLDGERDSHAIDRSKYVSVQTPQTVRADILWEAYGLEDRPEFTDDASRVEATGRRVQLYPGYSGNMKVTNPEDFAVAEALMRINN